MIYPVYYSFMCSREHLHITKRLLWEQEMIVWWCWSCLWFPRHAQKKSPEKTGSSCISEWLWRWLIMNLNSRNRIVKCIRSCLCLFLFKFPKLYLQYLSIIITYIQTNRQTDTQAKTFFYCYKYNKRFRNNCQTDNFLRAIIKSLIIVMNNRRSII